MIRQSLACYLAPAPEGIFERPLWHFSRGVGGRPAAPVAPRVKETNVNWVFSMALPVPRALAAKLPPTPRKKLHSEGAEMPLASAGGATPTCGGLSREQKPQIKPS